MKECAGQVFTSSRPRPPLSRYQSDDKGDAPFMRRSHAVLSEQLAHDMQIVQPFYLISLTAIAALKSWHRHVFPEPTDQDGNVLARNEIHCLLRVYCVYCKVSYFIFIFGIPLLLDAKIII